MTPAAQVFREMAERIDKTNEAEFAGAVVVMPPGGGEPIALLMVDPKPDLTQFFATVKSRVEIVTAEVMEAARARQQGWGR